MKSWTIGKRLTFGFGAVMAIVTALGAFTIFKLAHINAASDLIVQDSLPGVQNMMAAAHPERRSRRKGRARRGQAMAFARSGKVSSAKAVTPRAAVRRAPAAKVVKMTAGFSPILSSSS